MMSLAEQYCVVIAYVRVVRLQTNDLILLTEFEFFVNSHNLNILDLDFCILLCCRDIPNTHNKYVFVNLRKSNRADTQPAEAYILCIRRVVYHW